MSPINEESPIIRGDEPIREIEEDVLGRGTIARAIAHEIHAFDHSRGVVIGILGPWGSGKTSLLNLVRNELSTQYLTTVVDFNPWMFSGADQLVDHFFVELSSQLGVHNGKLHTISNQLEQYGEILSPLQVLPIVGQWFGRFGGGAKALKELRINREGGIHKRRQELEQSFLELEQPIVLFLDDIDRLTSSEIRDMFRLVRLTANFPNLVYIVAFDRLRVETALSEDRVAGRDYLEKILQIVYDLPAIPDSILGSQITSALVAALDGISTSGPFDSTRWQDLYLEILRPIFRNMRDVRRYMLSIRATVQTLHDKVDLGDLLCLEAIRLFLPDTFVAIEQHRDALTTERFTGDLFKDREKRWREEVEKIVADGGDHQETVKSTIRRLFPMGYQRIEQRLGTSGDLNISLRESKVAHRDVLSFYLEHTAGRSLQAFWSAIDAVPLLGDQNQFAGYMRAKDPTEWEDILDAVSSTEDLPQGAISSVPTILNLFDDMPERPKSWLEPETRRVVMRSIYIILQRISSPEKLEQEITNLLPNINSLTGMWMLFSIIGYEEPMGRGLVSEEASNRFNQLLRDKFRSSTSDVLIRERDMFWLFQWAYNTSMTTESEFALPEDMDLRKELIRQSVASRRSQGFDSRHVHTEQELRWDTLVKLFGSEDAIEAFTKSLDEETEDPKLKAAAGLVERYLRGWRPDKY